MYFRVVWYRFNPALRIEMRQDEGEAEYRFIYNLVTCSNSSSSSIAIVSLSLIAYCSSLVSM